MDSMVRNAEGEPGVLRVSSAEVVGLGKSEEPLAVVRSFTTFAEWSIFRLEEEKTMHSKPDL